MISHHFVAGRFLFDFMVQYNEFNESGDHSLIAYVNGILESIEEGNCVVDVNGIGVNVNISGSTMDRMPGIGEVVKLYTTPMLRKMHLLYLDFFQEMS